MSQKRVKQQRREQRGTSRREIEPTKTTRDELVEALTRAANGPEIGEEAYDALIALNAGIEDRDKALGDIVAVLNHVLDETGYRVEGDDRKWFLNAYAKALALGGKEVPSKLDEQRGEST